MDSEEQAASRPFHSIRGPPCANTAKGRFAFMGLSARTLRVISAA